jgi:hypothetical protein
MLAQKRLESAFLCIIQTFVEWLGGIREFFKLGRVSLRAIVEVGPRGSGVPSRPPPC